MAETTTNTKVNVVTGALSKIQSAEQGNGKIYFSTEGQLYYDFNGQRIKVQGGNSTIFKGTCVTPAATAAKVVTCGIFKSTDLVQGALIAVTFTYTNTYATLGSLTLNVDNTGAKPIKKQSNTSVSNLAAAAELIAGQTYFFQYDGTNWVCMNLDYNTTYSVMSASEASTGTATSGRVITAKVLADEITRRINSSISGLDSSVAVETGKAIAGFEEVNGKITNVTRVDTGLKVLDISCNYASGAPFTEGYRIEIPGRTDASAGEFFGISGDEMLKLAQGYYDCVIFNEWLPNIMTGVREICERCIGYRMYDQLLDNTGTKVSYIIGVFDDKIGNYGDTIYYNFNISNNIGTSLYCYTLQPLINNEELDEIFTVDYNDASALYKVYHEVYMGASSSGNYKICTCSYNNKTYYCADDIYYLVAQIMPFKLDFINIDYSTSTVYWLRAIQNSGFPGSPSGTTTWTNGSYSLLTGDTIGSYIPNNFSTISVKAKSASDTAIDVIPNSSNGTLTFIGSTNVKLTANATADTITIDASNTTYSAGTGISITGTNNAINATTPNFSALDISSGGITTKVLGDATALQQSHTSKLTLEAGSNVALTAANTADGAKVTISAQMQNGVIGIGISTIRAISESEYAALAGSRDPSTVYIVTPDTEV